MFNLQTLASMHASSLSIKLNSPDYFAELVTPLSENIFPEDEEASIGQFFEGGLRYALASLESIEEKTPDVKRAIDFMKSYDGKVASTMKRLLTALPADKRYFVITHGDTWNNNIMFLHDSQGKVARVKFVDFQVNSLTSNNYGKIMKMGLII